MKPKGVDCRKRDRAAGRRSCYRLRMVSLDLPLQEPQSQTATRARILDVAEQLFAEHGVAETTIRKITDTAHVNVAAVNYHFGGKDKLVRAVIDRRMLSLEQARGARLDAVETLAEGEGRAPTTAELVEALVAPLFEQALEGDSGWRHFIRLVSRLPWEPGIEELAPSPEALKVFARFDEALRRAAPHLAQDDAARLWRLGFMRGATQHTLLMLTAFKMGRIPKEAPFAESMATDVDTIQRQLVTFVAAGLSAR
jgi:AcrR family transcriptional regulator